MNNNQEGISKDCKDDEEDVPLPGFRFHPTDEELVGFYLRRKVEKKPLSIELIKQVDIYKFDPWDLPKPSSVGDKEGYFFCKRGRKYRNSIRPNRVTGSGFWKATGIDKPVYSNGGEGRDCIGLKKTLVYYRGCAGKGTKTDWMMHEFRLPAATDNTQATVNTTGIITNTKILDQEAEVWTLCRIFKRSASHRKYTQDWRELSTKRQAPSTTDQASSSKRPTLTSMKSNTTINTEFETYVSFGAPTPIQLQTDQIDHDLVNETKLLHVEQLSFMGGATQPSITSSLASSSSNISSPCGNNNNGGIQSRHQLDDQFFASGDWDELRSVVEFAFDRSSHNSSAQ